MKRSLLIFASLLVVAAWPSQSLRAGASELLCATLEPLLAPIEFGLGGHATVSPAPNAEGRRPGEAVTSDALLRLTIDGLNDESLTTINLRGDFYLPLVILIAATLAAPLAWRLRLRALALGLPLAYAACFARLYLTICYLFAHQAPRFYPLGAGRLQLIDGLVSALMMTPSLRFFTPLAVAALTLALSYAAYAARSAGTSPPAAPPAVP
jgi:hypothetical protein